jgi:hypothetical protein
MSMRIHKLATYLQADQAYTVIELLDQVRAALVEAYGDEIGAMLQQASAPAASESIGGDEELF